MQSTALLKLHKSQAPFAYAKAGMFPTLSKNEQQTSDSLFADDHARVKSCIACITDPLWKDVCMNLLNMMGAASVLKILKSTLGEFCVQDKAFDLLCETDEISAFVRKYDFVIMGSLQQYFPTLKQLRVKTAPHNYGSVN